MSKTQKLDAIRKYALPIRVTGPQRNTKAAYDALLDAIGPARVVLIGEASHGTREFYRERAHITMRLIAEKGFNAVIVEADWPDSYRVNRYVQQFGDKDKNANEALSEFVRFPTWMWRNTEVLKFVEWLRQYNGTIEDPSARAGFYGMDLYCLHSSANLVIDYLQKIDPQAAERARQRYECFLQYGEDTQEYAMSAAFGGKGCEKEVVTTLTDLRKKAPSYLAKDGWVAQDELFFATMNAEVVRDSEEYYRTMMFGGARSWNLRDKHMAKTIQALIKHRDRPDHPAKVVVWAHNSHLGDARHTEMGKRRGEWNVGQLMRQAYGPECYNVGLTTHTGTVSAAHNWDAKRQTIDVVPGRNDSYEGLFHAVDPSSDPEFLLLFNKVTTHEDGRAKKIPNEELVAALREPMLERYIGVIYRPRTELQSHYAESSISAQYDAVLHIDRTSFLIPLDERSVFEEKEDENVPETYPFGE